MQTQFLSHFVTTSNASLQASETQENTKPSGFQSHYQDVLSAKQTRATTAQLPANQMSASVPQEPLATNLDLSAFSRDRAKAIEQLRALVADIMTQPLQPKATAKDQAQLQLFSSLNLDFLSYKELAQRLEMLAQLDRHTEQQKGIEQQDKQRIRSIIASLHARLERGQEALLGGSTLKSLDLNRKDMELEIDSLFADVGFDSDTPVVAIS